MGAAQSWCFGEQTREDHVLLPPGKRHHSGSSTSSRSSNGHANGAALPHARSYPKAIQVQGPAYSSGSFESKYEIISEIGHGSTSIVYRCRDRRTGSLHACKIIDRRALHGKRNELLQQFQVEIQVLQSMKHPNIIRIDDVYLTDSKICMVTEYMDGGELFDYIVDKGTLSEVEASAIVRKIMSAVSYMHNCGVIHRDLKPENLMLTSKSAGAEVKIIDFGHASLNQPMVARAPFEEAAMLKAMTVHARDDAPEQIFDFEKRQSCFAPCGAGGPRCGGSCSCRCSNLACFCR